MVRLSSKTDPALNRQALEDRLRELQEALDRAHRADEVKSTFLATMSHEIREPMNGVLGMTRLLLETPLSDEQMEYVGAVHDSGQALLTIINDILDLSRMEAGKLELDHIPFDPRTVVERALSILRPRADAKQLPLICTIASDVPSALCGDPARLRQILLNLLGNAIKFTDRGEIGLAVDVIKADADRAVIGFHIRDSGIGIPDHLTAELFTAFAQADPSVTRLYGGSGLGLSICKRLTDLIGGSIEVDSAEGVGTVFNLQLPFNIVLNRSEAPPNGQIKGLGLLVVDANETTRMTLYQQALGWGAITHLAGSCPEALDALDQCLAAGSPIEIVLIDNRLPDGSGEDLGRRIRADLRFSAVQLVMIASSGLRGDATRASEAGFAAYLPKPVTATDLLSCLLRLSDPVVRKSRHDLITTHSLFETKPANLDILLADDNPLNRRLATLMLAKFGHRIDAVVDGEEAIRSLQDKHYDLVLMDVQMPGLGGLETTRRIRQMDNRRAAVPIVAVTANAMKDDQRKCLEAGMNDYVTKPIDRARLLSKVHQWGYRQREGDPKASTS